MKKLFMICMLLLLTACTSAELEIDMIQQVEQDLEPELEMDMTQQVEQDLEKILNSNSGMSSNPYDAIAAHKTEFNRIVSQNEVALNHFLNKFAKSDENGLEEYIMAAACSEILGEKNPVSEWTTGKDWYQQYIEAVKE